MACWSCCQCIAKSRTSLRFILSESRWWIIIGLCWCIKGMQLLVIAWLHLRRRLFISYLLFWICDTNVSKKKCLGIHESGNCFVIAVWSKLKFYWIGKCKYLVYTCSGFETRIFSCNNIGNILCKFNGKLLWSLKVGLQPEVQHISGEISSVCCSLYTSCSIKHQLFSMYNV